MKSKFTVRQIDVNVLSATSYDNSNFTPDFVQQSQGIYVAEITNITEDYEDIYTAPRYMHDPENNIDIIFGTFVAEDGKVFLFLKALEGGTPVEGYFNGLSFEVAK